MPQNSGRGLGPRPRDLRERIVIVNAFLIERMYPKPDDPFIVLKSDRDIANDIFDERRIVVSLHRHMSLVFPFEQRIQGCGSRSLGQFHEFFNPYEFRCRPSPGRLRISTVT